jgi:hypothetical protein
MRQRHLVVGLSCVWAATAFVAGCSGGSSGSSGPAPATPSTVTGPSAVTAPSTTSSSVTSPASSSAAVRVIDRSSRDDAGFTSPSGHIACLFLDGLDGPFVTCEINQKSWKPPPRPADCDLDWGYGITLRIHADFFCAGDTVRGDKEAGTDGSVILAYGTAMRFRSFTCTSQRTGVDCVNAKTRAGFLLSRERYQLRKG